MSDLTPWEMAVMRLGEAYLKREMVGNEPYTAAGSDAYKNELREAVAAALDEAVALTPVGMTGIMLAVGNAAPKDGAETVATSASTVADVTAVPLAPGDTSRIVEYIADLNGHRNTLRSILRLLVTQRQLAHIDALAAFDEYKRQPKDSQQAVDAWHEWRRLRTLCTQLDDQAYGVTS